MSRRSNRAVCLAVLLLFTGCSKEPAAPSHPPAERVILISLDTLRPDHLSLYGYPRPTSPRLEELATEAAVFDAAMSQAPYTLPSHMTMTP